MKLSAYGIQVELPSGWDGRIYRRPDGEPTLHAGNFSLPAEDGDFGSGAVAAMDDDGVFIVLTEYDPADAGRGLFAHQGMPAPLQADEFDPNAMQRRVPGRFGLQRFFSQAGRAWCLYTVLGSGPGLVRRANDVLRTVTISARPADQASAP